MQSLQQLRPSFKAVEGEGFFEFTAETEMNLEDLQLFGEVGVFHPQIEPAFTDGASGTSV